MKNNIRQYRDHYGWSQAYLAEMIGTSQPQIDRLEKKDPRELRKGWLEKLSQALKTSEENLVTGRDDIIITSDDTRIDLDKYNDIICIVVDAWRSEKSNLTSHELIPLAQRVYNDFKDQPTDKIKEIVISFLTYTTKIK